MLAQGRLKDLGPLLAIWAATMLVLVATNDLGSALLYFGIFIAMLYIATGAALVRARRAGLFVAGGFVADRTIPHVAERITNWLHPFTSQKVFCPLNGQMELRQDCQSYQLVKSLYSIANGGFGGTGLGKGTFTTTGGTPLIPDVKTDFIYSALAQELGLVGVSALLLVFMVFVARGMKVALRVDDGFSKLLAAGLTFGFALQTFTIVGGILRIIPLTGITLPFVSYGGSSIVANFILLAGSCSSSPTARTPSHEQAHLPGRDRRRSSCSPALILATTYWQTWASAGLAARQDNEIQRVAQFTIDRGLIVASNGKTVLAANVKKKVNGQTLYFRTYPTPRARLAGRRLLDAEPGALRARAVREQLPDRLERRSLDDLRHGRRPAQGDDDQGQQPRADDPAGRAVARAAPARRASAAPPSC